MMYEGLAELVRARDDLDRYRAALGDVLFELAKHRPAYRVVGVEIGRGSGGEPVLRVRRVYALSQRTHQRLRFLVWPSGR